MLELYYRVARESATKKALDEVKQRLKAAEDASKVSHIPWRQCNNGLTSSRGTGSLCNSRPMPSPMSLPIPEKSRTFFAIMKLPGGG